NTPTPEAAPPTPVSVALLTQEEGFEIARAIVGQVEPRKTASISFELAGQLDQIAVDEGESVSAGQVIATQDTDLLEAEKTRALASRDATQAQLDFALQTVERSSALSARGFASQERLDQAVATRDELTSRIAEIDANLRSIDIQLEKSVLTAPFDGQITRRMVDGGEALSPGQMVVELVETGVPQLRVGLPLTLTEEALSQVSVLVDGVTFPATLASVRPDIDPVTRTRTALFDVTSQTPLVFGQTATLQLQVTVDQPGVWMPLRSLKEGARGQWTILVVDEQNVVRTATVEVLHTQSDRVFVQGSFPSGTRLILEGPQRVAPGQQVAITTTQSGA
ncbi:MAG: efflux RND transporter periplasmic adaptor subunit, partial [Pseudomonadota bacterium]